MITEKEKSVEEIRIDILHFRIGQLEGAIMEALPYFEEMTEYTEYLVKNEGDMPHTAERAKEARQVIINLKQLISHE